MMLTMDICCFGETVGSVWRGTDLAMLKAGTRMGSDVSSSSWVVNSTWLQSHPHVGVQ